MPGDDASLTAGALLRRLALIAALSFAGGALAVLAGLWVSRGFADLGLGGAPLVALVLGAGLTTALASALMAAMFHSDRSGHDEMVRRFSEERERTRQD